MSKREFFMVNDEVMDVKTLMKILKEIHKKWGNYDIWLSKDDEGNEFLRMSKQTSVSLAIDIEQKRIIFFPSWCFPSLEK